MIKETITDNTLKGGFKDDDIVITAGVSTKDISKLINEITYSCIRNHRKTFITGRDISKLHSLMRSWERSKLVMDIEYQNLSIWKRYKKLLKFVSEIDKFDKEFSELVIEYEHLLIDNSLRSQ